MLPPATEIMKLTWVKFPWAPWNFKLHIGDKNGPIAIAQTWLLSRKDIDLKNRLWFIRGSIYEHYLGIDYPLCIMTRRYWACYELEILGQKEKLTTYLMGDRMKCLDSAKQEIMHFFLPNLLWSSTIEVTIFPIEQWQNYWQLLACAGLYAFGGGRVAGMSVKVFTGDEPIDD